MWQIPMLLPKLMTHLNATTSKNLDKQNADSKTKKNEDKK